VTVQRDGVDSLLESDAGYRIEALIGRGP